MDRRPLENALALVDLLDSGWQPGDAELEAASYLETWAVVPSYEGAPFHIIGIAWSLPVKRGFINAPVLGFDSVRRWARTWDVWVVLGNRIQEWPDFDPAGVQRASAAWLLEELRLLPQSA